MFNGRYVEEEAITRLAGRRSRSGNCGTSRNGGVRKRRRKKDRPSVDSFLVGGRGMRGRAQLSATTRYENAPFFRPNCHSLTTYTATAARTSPTIQRCKTLIVFSANSSHHYLNHRTPPNIIQSTTQSYCGSPRIDVKTPDTTAPVDTTNRRTNTVSSE